MTINQSALDKIVKNIYESNKDWHNEVPFPLYHYTSAEGLTGILSTRSLWLTDLRYMNDLSELQYSRSLFLKQIEDFLKLTSINDVQRIFLDNISHLFRDPNLYPSMYSASFCEDGNLLSQWRAYRGRGGGYAIGIDFFLTLRLLDKPCVLRKVVYDTEQQKKLIDKAIRSFLEFIEQFGSDIKEAKDQRDLATQMRDAFIGAVSDFMYTFKHPDFREEREWRLVHSYRFSPRFERGTEPPKFRTYEGNVIPYCTVSLKTAVAASCEDARGIRFPFSEIVIGPTINAELNQESVKMFLLTLNPDVDPEIRHSEIPLRWL